MKTKSIFSRGFLFVIAAGSLCLVPKAEASLTFTFVEVGGDVVATLSGSLSLSGAVMPTGADDIAGPASMFLQGSPASFLYLPAGVSYDLFGISDITLGANSPSMTASFTTMTTPIGWGGGAMGEPVSLYFDSSASSNGSVTPVGAFIWSGQTLESIGMNYLRTSANPWTLLTFPGTGEKIQFVAGSVPEPSALMLFGVGAIRLLLRRRVDAVSR